MLTHNIFLIGFMGTGKSTVAAYFSKRYDMEIVEMDEAIVKKEGKSISQIFAEEGEGYFRNLETALLEELTMKTNYVVSCGGGIVLRDENISLMKKNGKIVLLTASPEEIFKRVKNDECRPLLKGRKSVNAIAELMEERCVKYEKAADILIRTDGKSVDKICEEVVKKLEREIE